MLTLLGANLVPLIIAFVIGVITGWWAWAHYRADANVSTTLPEVPSVAASIPLAAVSAAVAVPAAVKAAAKPKAVAKPKAAAPVKLVEAPAGKPAAPKANAAPRVAAKAAAPKVVATAKTAAKPKTVAAKPVAAQKPKAVAKAAPAPKVVPAANAVAAPKPKAVSKPRAAPKPKLPDDLLQLKGVGPKLNTLLISLGVNRFDQIAKWKAKDVAAINAQLGTFRGRIERENWIEQAGFLAKGDVKSFEAKYGKLDSENR